MMKKFLSALLAVSMIITCLILPTTAAPARLEGLDGMIYTPVTTEEELATALANGGNILLKNDIELTGTKFGSITTLKIGTTLNGGGHTLTYKGSRSLPLFMLSAGTAVGEARITLIDINIGSDATPITMTGNFGLFQASAVKYGCQAIFQDVNFHVKKTGVTGTSGAIFDTTSDILEFYGCSLNVNMSGATGGLQGAWFGEVGLSQVIMNGCSTMGSVSGAAVGGIAAQVGGGTLDLINCKNFATLNGTTYVGGMVGNIGTGATGLYITGCVNYGALKSTGSSYNNMVGGMVGRMSNKSSESTLHVIYDCINYGTLTSGSSAGGIIGRSHDHDYGSNTHLTMRGCLNLGNVSGTSYAGGMIGVSSPLVYLTEITDCANLGKITSSSGYAGNFGGMLNSAVITNSYAMGVVSAASAEKQGALGGQCGNTYTAQAGSAGGGHVGEAPTVADVYYLGTFANHVHGASAVTDANMADVLAKLEALYGMTFIKADASDANRKIVAAEPLVRGVQPIEAEDGTVLGMRLVATTNAVDAFKSFGMRVTVMTADKTETTDYNSCTLGDSIEASGKSVTASSLSGKKLFTAEFKGLPATGRVTVKVTPYVIGTDNTEYTGNAKIIALENGQFYQEPVMLNGQLMDNFTVLYPTASLKAEDVLAKHLANHLTDLLGCKVAAMPDNTTIPYDNTCLIMVGNTKYNATAPAGRSISRPDAAKASIALTGDNTAQLSETVQYFLETLEVRIAAGNCTWDITETITAPVDQTVSIMAYNTGAKNNANIKKFEAELIFDYLPDIYTMQEPWAGFLDDFMNDYMVKPTESFVDGSGKHPSQSDSDLGPEGNFANGTGNGYYGIFWGEPRWAPGDKCTAGRASYSVILYAKDRFTLDESNSGTFWLSDTPDGSGTNASGSNFARCATYATLTDNNTGEKIVVVNVHLDFVESVKVAQVSILLEELTARLGTDKTFFITGDMNAKVYDKAIQTYFENDYMNMTALDHVAERSYRNAESIDWLLTNKPDAVDVKYYNYCGEFTFCNNLWNDNMCVGMPSDHPAVYAEVIINTKQ